MKINSAIYEAIKRNNGMVTTAEVTKLGYSRTLLYNYAKEGLLERCRNGVYKLPDTVWDDMYIIMFCSDKIVFSHEVALYLNGFLEKMPDIYTLTIPNNSMLSNSLQGESICYYIKPELQDLGLIEKSTKYGNKVRCYNAERTICDILRSRSRVGEETVNKAIQSYKAYDKKNLKQLTEYAKKLRIAKVMKKYMKDFAEVLD